MSNQKKKREWENGRKISDKIMQKRKESKRTSVFARLIIKKKKNVFARKSEFKTDLIARPQILVHMYKDVHLSTNDLNPSFPNVVMCLLQEFEDPFPKEIPYGDLCIKFLKSYGKLNKKYAK